MLAYLLQAISPAPDPREENGDPHPHRKDNHARQRQSLEVLRAALAPQRLVQPRSLFPAPEDDLDLPALAVGRGQSFRAQLLRRDVRYEDVPAREEQRPALRRAPFRLGVPVDLAAAFLRFLAARPDGHQTRGMFGGGEFHADVEAVSAMPFEKRCEGFAVHGCGSDVEREAAQPKRAFRRDRGETFHREVSHVPEDQVVGTIQGKHVPAAGLVLLGAGNDPRNGSLKQRLNEDPLGFILRIPKIMIAIGEEIGKKPSSTKSIPQMKPKLFIAAAVLICLPSVASAFSLDFTGVAPGTTIPPNPLTISVPGYGNVTFEALIGSNLVVQPVSGTPAIAFDQEEGLRISFEGVGITDVSFAYVGVSIGESFLVTPDPNVANQFIMTLQGSGDGAGLSGVTWNAVPEPSSALLGVIGASLLVLRRRR